jgi:hypothetical protein
MRDFFAAAELCNAAKRAAILQTSASPMPHRANLALHSVSWATPASRAPVVAWSKACIALGQKGGGGELCNIAKRAQSLNTERWTTQL